MTANNRRTGAGAEFIVLGGSKPFMRVEQGEGFTITVSGSQQYGRDLSIASEREQLMIRALTREEALALQGKKWCSHKDHEGDDVLPISAFYESSRYADRRRTYCVECEKRMRNQRYAAKAAAAGRSVKHYRKRTV